MSDGCSGNVFTTGGNAAEGSTCVFPFTYSGTTYYKCTTADNSGVAWCATTSDYPNDGEWGNCVGCRTTGTLADCRCSANAVLLDGTKNATTLQTLPSSQQCASFSPMGSYPWTNGTKKMCRVDRHDFQLAEGTSQGQPNGWQGTDAVTCMHEVLKRPWCNPNLFFWEETTYGTDNTAGNFNCACALANTIHDFWKQGECASDGPTWKWLDEYKDNAWECMQAVMKRQDCYKSDFRLATKDYGGDGNCGCIESNPEKQNTCTWDANRVDHIDNYKILDSMTTDCTDAHGPDGSTKPSAGTPIKGGALIDSADYWGTVTYKIHLPRGGFTPRLIKQKSRCHNAEQMWLGDPVHSKTTSTAYSTAQACMEAVLNTSECMKTVMKYNPTNKECGCVTGGNAGWTCNWKEKEHSDEGHRIEYCLAENNRAWGSSLDDKRNTLIVLLSDRGLCTVGECQGKNNGELLNMCPHSGADFYRIDPPKSCYSAVNYNYLTNYRNTQSENGVLGRNRLLLSQNSVWMLKVQDDGNLVSSTHTQARARMPTHTNANTHAQTLTSRALISYTSVCARRCGTKGLTAIKTTSGHRVVLSLGVPQYCSVFKLMEMPSCTSMVALSGLQIRTVWTLLLSVRRRIASGS